MFSLKDVIPTSTVYFTKQTILVQLLFLFILTVVNKIVLGTLVHTGLLFFVIFWRLH